ncbi:metallophosphoesterase [Fusibacter tunisiensis]|uniref:MPP superfamily phosphohydrolase n=1 Tax=Fusibacter tunisiensis TaxID=1008308 RepID=A0ABS2MP17_9FIRM|nr:metallophosphoesterase [Fusibacter tunisiensis]MBM7561146.1 putative MPP superfamily phosphohydrolase [Fusibacter tunisiensis]
MKKTIYILIGLFALTGFILYQNNALEITKIEVRDETIPSAFNTFRIVQISDLHNKGFGNQQERLVKAVNALSPDIVVITGDLIDRRKYDLALAMEFVEKIADFVPIYYVSGNHEAWSGNYDEIVSALSQAGVHILDDKALALKKADEEIRIIGLSDPDFLTSTYLDGTNYTKMEKNLKALTEPSVYQILLSHRPECFELYAHYNINLTFSGHAHGGQFRLPLVGGFIAPDQGIFPKYSSGLYQSGQAKMIVSRGLGNSIIPIRLFNRPEIVLVELNP